MFSFRTDEFFGGGLAHGLSQSLSGDGVFGGQDSVVECLSSPGHDDGDDDVDDGELQVQVLWNQGVWSVLGYQLTDDDDGWKRVYEAAKKQQIV